MIDMDSAHLSTWLQYLTTSEDSEHALGPEGRDQLTKLLDLMISYVCDGLQPLESFANEDFLESFAGITSALVKICKKRKLPVYTRIAEALESPEDDSGGSQCCPTVQGIGEVNDKIAALREPLSLRVIAVVTQLVQGQWGRCLGQMLSRHTRPYSGKADPS